ncbi:MAG: hypothetical protein QG557_60 [Pseudomonadota bacterium]|jgi:hypothetical protein|nr:hypothetical protein [Pseudomonadota bacterium]
MFIQKLARLSFTLCLCSALTCVASDDKREAEFAIDIAQNLSSGRIVWLQAQNQPFLTLYTEVATTAPDGIVILLHDMGGHPNQDKIMTLLHNFFPEHRWSTLSIQMPLREEGAKIEDYYSLFPEARERIFSAVNFAKQQKAEKVVIIGYGLGGLMATSALQEKNSNINGLITISLSSSDIGEIYAQTLPFISSLTMPMLDVYGELDSPDVVYSAKERKNIGRIKSKYRQIKLDNEGHLYSNDSGLLVKRIYSWVNRVISNKSQELPRICSSKD